MHALMHTQCATTGLYHQSIKVKAWVEEMELIRRDMQRMQVGVGTFNGLTFVVMESDPDCSRASAQ